MSLRADFLLDPDVVFLNHGSFGATPRPVFAVYQRWQRELERQPVAFLGRRFTALMRDARQALAAFLHVAARDVVYVTNATTGLNIVARSLALGPDDEVLTTDHEYGALTRTWRFLARKRGFRLVEQPIPLPLTTPEAFVQALWQGVTPRTRVIFLSHITSSTALIFPVAEVCRRARESGILTVIDGAHAPGQIPLRLDELGADFYVGNLHKWLCAPKGAAFLYARRAAQTLLEPLVVSWGWEPEPEFASESPFVDLFEWQGTRDIAAFLAVPAAIRYQQERGWERVRARCHALAAEAQRRLEALLGVPPLHTDPDRWIGQMAAVRFPHPDPASVQAALYTRFRIEVPFLPWKDGACLRVSVQGYNTSQDVEALLDALPQVL